jgi:cellulose synthase/poly-beta-1,6-N-acetylglucosamine synthase-like glycosyltransferase
MNRTTLPRQSRGITGRKAGALNAALDIVLPQLDADDLVVCMDADSTIHLDLLVNAEAHFCR